MNRTASHPNQHFYDLFRTVLEQTQDPATLALTLDEVEDPTDHRVKNIVYSLLQGAADRPHSSSNPTNEQDFFRARQIPDSHMPGRTPDSEPSQHPSRVLELIHELDQIRSRAGHEPTPITSREALLQLKAQVIPPDHILVYPFYYTMTGHGRVTQLIIENYAPPRTPAYQHNHYNRVILPALRDAATDFVSTMHQHPSTHAPIQGRLRESSDIVTEKLDIVLNIRINPATGTALMTEAETNELTTAWARTLHKHHLKPNLEPTKRV